MRQVTQRMCLPRPANQPNTPNARCFAKLRVQLEPELASYCAAAPEVIT